MARELLCWSHSGFFGPKVCSSKLNCPSPKCMQVSMITAGCSKFQISCSKSMASDTESRRSTENYQPTSWDYNMLQSLGTATPELDDNIVSKDAANLMEEVRCLIRDEQAKSSVVLQLIDDIEGLGLKYRFEDDVISALHRVLPSQDLNDNAISTLHYTSLRFKLLRQNSFEVSQEVFEKFKGEDGEFKEELREDVKGMLSLYEASQLGFEGETILDEANVFSSKHLIHLLHLPSTTESINRKINYTLELHFHHRMQRLEARWNIETYDDSQSNINRALLLLAKSDFNSVQFVYQREIADLARWWKDIGLSDKLTFARADKVMENYIFSVAMVSQPQYHKCRKSLTKALYFIITIDDIYDFYGSPDELQLFTTAVERWDLSMVNELPDYMKLCFLALYNTTNEVAYEILQDRGQSVISYLAKAWADLMKAYLQEAKWSSSNETPSFQEYLDNGWMSSSGPLLMMYAYFYMSDNIDTEELEYLQNYPALLSLPSLILRVCNDKGAIDRGEVEKGALYYINETGKSVKETQEHMQDLIEETWKKLNKEVTRSSQFPQVFRESAFGLARISHIHYQYFQNVRTSDSTSKNYVTSLFDQPISL